MKKILLIFVLILSLSLFVTACDGGDNDNENDNATEDDNVSEKIKMTAKIINISDVLEVEVIEDPYNSGIFHVHVGNDTKITSDGKNISTSELAVGDEIEIYYSGQVMLSYPPQINARKIVVK